VALGLLRSGARVAAVLVSQAGLRETVTRSGPPGDRLTTHSRDSPPARRPSLAEVVTAIVDGLSGLVDVSSSGALSPPR
jgi:hypothetical protein